MPCIRNLRIPVATVVQMAAEGITGEKIIQAMPDLEKEDIYEALQYAAAAVLEQTLPYVTST